MEVRDQSSHSTPSLLRWLRANALLLLILLLTCFFHNSYAEGSLPDSQLEETVCGRLAERWAFLNWSAAAGEPDDSLLAQTPNAARTDFTTSDHRTLVGFDIAASPGMPKKGTLLFIQGNGMLADQALRWVDQFADAGLEVYVFDFRGYGRSNGNRRLKAMVADYQALIQHLIDHAQKPLFLYGVSFGGVLLSNALHMLPGDSRAVIDSTPSVVSSLGCPSSFDPVEHIPRDAKNVAFIAGERDTLVPPAMTRVIREKVMKSGGRAFLYNDLAHPFSEFPVNRFNYVIEFLLGSAGENNDKK